MSEKEKSGGAFRSILRLASYAPKSRKRELVFVLALMLVGAIAEMVTLGAIIPFLAVLADPAQSQAAPWLMPIFSAFGYDAGDNLVVPAAMLFAVVALSACVIRLILAYTSTKFIYGVGHDLGSEVFRHTISQPYAYYTTMNTSQQLAAIGKIDAVVNGVLFQAMTLVTSLFLSVFIISALVFIDPLVALSSASVFGLMYLGVMALTRPRVSQNSTVWARSLAQRIQALQEGVGGIRDVLIDRSHSILIDRYTGIDKSLRDAQGSNSFLASSPRLVIEAIGMVFIAGLAVTLSGRPGGVSAALPVLGALALGAQRLLPMLQQGYAAWTYIGANRKSLEDLLEILELPIDPRIAGPDRPEPIPFERDLALTDVSFRYTPDRPIVIDGVSLTIEKGSRVGFIGKTGSGKSTIIDLIMGLLSPAGGTIAIDGRPLDVDSVGGWQARIAHVPQTIYLADATFAANIAFGVPAADVDMVRVRDAAERAEIANYIDSLPEGYATFVGERGIRLSGGQRQRIGIARALYKRADVLVLDEATSALDNETEAAVMQSIEKLNRNLTIIIIAHRLSTVEMCDVVFELSAGRLIGERRPTPARAADRTQNARN